MNTNSSTAMALRISVVLGIALTVAGLVLSVTGNGDRVLYSGIFLLVISPLIGVLVTFISLVLSGDRFWAGIAAVLIAVTFSGVIASLL